MTNCIGKASMFNGLNVATFVRYRNWLWLDNMLSSLACKFEEEITAFGCTHCHWWHCWVWCKGPIRDAELDVGWGPPPPLTRLVNAAACFLSNPVSILNQFKRIYIDVSRKNGHKSIVDTTFDTSTWKYRRYRYRYFRSIVDSIDVDIDIRYSQITTLSRSNHFRSCYHFHAVIVYCGERDWHDFDSTSRGHWRSLKWWYSISRPGFL